MMLKTQSLALRNTRSAPPTAHRHFPPPPRPTFPHKTRCTSSSSDTELTPNDTKPTVSTTPPSSESDTTPSAPLPSPHDTTSSLPSSPSSSPSRVNETTSSTISQPLSSSSSSSSSSPSASSASNDVNETSSSTTSQPLVAQLLGELGSGEFWKQCQRASPDVPWDILAVVKLTGLGFGVAILLVALSMPLAEALHAVPGQAPDLRSVAVLHLGQELLLLSAVTTILWSALKDCKPRSEGMFDFRMERDWVVVTWSLCAVLFPLVDPVIYTLWSSATSDVNQSLQDLLSAVSSTTSPALSPMKMEDMLRQCRLNGDYTSLGLHFLATGIVGPLWEEIFWRGFVLPSFASKKIARLSPAAAVSFSSGQFALLHMSLPNALPIFMLSSACDMLCLRSGGRIGYSYMLHALWNSSQWIGVAFLGKEMFV